MTPGNNSGDSSTVWVRIWDAPTRWFHWAVAALVATSWFTGSQAYMKAHLWSGLTLLALLIFRLVWGVIGSTTARFSDFLHPPTRVLGYFRALLSHDKPAYAGHNPAGGWMVLTLMAFLLAQVTTGLFSNDGIRFMGPLALRVSADTSDRLSELHRLLFNGILCLVWLHLVAVFFYLLVKGENLIRPMVTGYKHRAHVPSNLTLNFIHAAVAVLVMAAAAGLVMFFLT